MSAAPGSACGPLGHHEPTPAASAETSVTLDMPPQLDQANLPPPGRLSESNSDDERRSYTKVYGTRPDGTKVLLIPVDELPEGVRIRGDRSVASNGANVIRLPHARRSPDFGFGHCLPGASQASSSSGQAHSDARQTPAEKEREV
jgi:hypothetical protein